MAGREARRSFVVREAMQRTPVNQDGAVAVAKPRSSSARPSETRQRPPSLVAKPNFLGFIWFEFDVDDGVFWVWWLMVVCKKKRIWR
ncbi:hypothetical protein Q3G72_016658 [Acer saccharum]|nr:hypothetical protein Q3G72_016658 [Acer saccharum]